MRTYQYLTFAWHIFLAYYTEKNKSYAKTFAQ